MSDEFYLPEDVMEWVALKKSEYLSTLIQNHQASDVQIEEYHQFNHLVAKTIGESDRSFEQKVDGHKLSTFIRSYPEGTQVVIGAVFPDPKNSSEIFVPILTFMSRNNELIKIFSVGKQMNSPTLN
jgi:hypothetical protein